MQVRELIEDLLKCPPNAEVILSSDEEGNSHLRARGVWYGRFDPSDQYYIESYFSEDWEEEYEEEEWDEMIRASVPCIIISP